MCCFKLHSRYSYCKIIHFLMHIFMFVFHCWYKKLFTKILINFQMCQTICKSKRPSINLPKWIKSSAKTFFILEHITKMQISLEISSIHHLKEKWIRWNLLNMQIIFGKYRWSIKIMFYSICVDLKKDVK